MLQAILKEDGRGLHCLIVQVDGLVGAVTHVREGTLLAALKGKEEFGGERDEVAGRIKGVEVAKGDQGSKGDEGSGTEGSGAEDEGKGKGKGMEGEGEEKPSKMQILVWRSEGMGEYMANELGPKFKIPKGFY